MNNVTSKKMIHIASVFSLFCCFYIFLFLPLKFNGLLSIFGDVFAYYLPVFYSPRSLWTNLLYSGFPSLADPQFQLWYPLNYFFSLFSNSWNGFIISAYVLASCFSYGYVYSLTSSRLAATISGIVYGMSGFMVAYWGYSTIIHAAPWIPLLIWSLEKLRHKFDGGWFIAGSCAVACILLAGHPQISIYGLAVATAYVLVLGYSAPIGRWKYYRIYFIAMFLGLSLAAIQLLPTLEFVALSVRSNMSFEDFVSYSLPIRQVIQLIFPFYTPSQFNSIGLLGYVGLLPPVLSIIGFFSYKDRAQTGFWLAVTLFAFLLTLGSDTPLAQLMYHVPVYNKFRAPVRNFLEMSLAISILAGFGISALQKQIVSHRLLFKIILASTGVIIASFATTLFLGEPIHPFAKNLNNLLSFAWVVILPTAFFLIGVAILIFWSKAVHFKSRGFLLLLIIVVDFGSFSWLHHYRISDDFKYKNSLTPTTSIKNYKKLLTYSNQRILPTRGVMGTYYNKDNYPNKGTLNEIPPNTSLLWGVPSASGYGPLILSRYSQLLSIDSFGSVPESLLNETDRTLDIMSIRYIFIPQVTLNSSFLANANRWHYVESINNTSIVYENLRAMPRAWLVPEVITAKSEEVLQAIKTSKLPDGRLYDPSKIAIVEEQLNLKPQNPDLSGTAKMLDLSNTKLEVQTNSSSPTFLVLSDIYYPGWQATVDGKPVHIFQTNYVLRGIAISPGLHKVKVEFKPLTWQLGAGISTASLSLLGYLGFKFRGKANK